MTDAECLLAAADNVEATYLAVGGAVEGARFEIEKGWTVCRSDLEHPVSNFALIRSLDEADAAAFRRFCAQSGILHAYLLPGSGQSNALPRMLRSGWRASGVLTVMALGKPRESTPAQLRVLSDFENRMDATRHMGRIFFSRYASGVRDRIARATAASSCAIVAAEGGWAMLSRTGETLGIYSLCVLPEYRRLGKGSALLEAILRLSFEENRIPVLQCDASLEGWYRRWGFRGLGNIRIFT